MSTDNSQSVSSNIGPRTNAFTELCLLASRERWCWKIGCTTCGHDSFRQALWALVHGKHPDVEWSIDSRSAESTTSAPRKSAPSRQQWSSASQRRLQAIAAEVDLPGVAASASFPDWLGYLGLVLWYTEDVERARSVLTDALVPQLLGLISPDSDGAVFLTDIARLSPQGRRLLWRDLEAVETAIGVRRLAASARI